MSIRCSTSSPHRFAAGIVIIHSIIISQKQIMASFAAEEENAPSSSASVVACCLPSDHIWRLPNNGDRRREKSGGGGAAAGVPRKYRVFYTCRKGILSRLNTVRLLHVVVVHTHIRGQRSGSPIIIMRAQKTLGKDDNDMVAGKNQRHPALLSIDPSEISDLLWKMGVSFQAESTSIRNLCLLSPQPPPPLPHEPPLKETFTGAPQSSSAVFTMSFRFAD